MWTPHDCVDPDAVDPDASGPAAAAATHLHNIGGVVLPPLAFSWLDAHGKALAVGDFLDGDLSRGRDDVTADDYDGSKSFKVGVGPRNLSEEQGFLASMSQTALPTDARKGRFRLACPNSDRAAGTRRGVMSVTPGSRDVSATARDRAARCSQGNQTWKHVRQQRSSGSNVRSLIIKAQRICTALGEAAGTSPDRVVTAVRRMRVSEELITLRNQVHRALNTGGDVKETAAMKNGKAYEVIVRDRFRTDSSDTVSHVNEVGFDFLPADGRKGCAAPSLPPSL